MTMAETMMQPNVFDRLLKDRIIWLGSEVRDDNANEIAASAEKSLPSSYSIYLSCAPKAWTGIKTRPVSQNLKTERLIQ